MNINKDTIRVSTGIYHDVEQVDGVIQTACVSVSRQLFSK